MSARTAYSSKAQVDRRRKQAPLPPIRVEGVPYVKRYQLGDGRVRLVSPAGKVTFANAQKAAEEGQRIARELHNGGSEASIFTAADRASFAQAQRDVAPHRVPVHVATSQWAAAMELLKGREIQDVLRAGLLAVERPIYTVPIIVAELLAAKAPADLHARYRRGLESTLADFAEKFPGDIAAIKPADIERYLEGRKVGTRRRDNLLTEIRHLFKFARYRSYLPDQISAAAKVPKINQLSGHIGIFSAAEVQLFIAHVAEPWLPYLAIAAWSGIRSEEIALAKDAAKRKDAIRWEDFDWDHREIAVRAEVAKTSTPRRCPISENLWEWLRPWRDRKAKGLVCTAGRPDREFADDGRLIRALNRALKLAHGKDFLPGMAPQLDRVSWHQNGLRHSYGSYRMAVIQNMHQLSYEMGNSIAMVKRHYHNPRPLAEAKAYFAITPAALPSNVTQLQLLIA